MPEEPGGLRQAGRDAARPRATRRLTARRRPTWWSSTPAPSSRRPGRSRSRPSWRSSELRRPGARLVVTGCLAERYGDELADALPEVDLVAGFGVPVTLTARRDRRSRRSTCSTCRARRPRPPWAYVKVAEGCDRKCGFCAIPSFRGRQRSRALGDILAEVESLDVEEVVLVAQDLASYGRDLGGRRRADRVAGRGRGGASAADPAALSVSIRAHRRSDRRHGCDRLPLFRPVAAARLPTPPAAHAPLGRWRPVPRADRAHPGRLPRRRPAVLLHRWLSRRDRGGSRPAAGVPGGSGPRLGRVLPFFPGGGHLRRRPPGPGRPGPRRGAPGRVRRAAGRHHGPPAPGS